MTETTTTASVALKPKLLDQVRHALRVKHYSPKTEEAYLHWIKKFIFFHNKKHSLYEELTPP